MARGRALKNTMAVAPERVQPKSKKDILKEMHRSGKEDIAYAKEQLMRGHIKMTAAKMLMKNKDMGMGE